MSARTRDHPKVPSRAPAPKATPTPVRHSTAATAPAEQVPGNQELLHALDVQARLSVSRPDDPDEHEADRIADAFVSGGNLPARTPPAARAPARLQRKCASCGDDDMSISRKASASGAVAHSAVHNVRSALRVSRGDPLPPRVRSEYEGFFGSSLAAVRVHTDSAAHTAARSLSAHAFTRGSNIFFAPGQFAPDTHAGRHLMAHELAHATQAAAPPAFAAAAAPGRIRRQPATTAPAVTPAGVDVIARAMREDRVADVVEGLRNRSIDELKSLRTALETATRQKIERWLLAHRNSGPSALQVAGGLLALAAAPLTGGTSLATAVPLLHSPGQSAAQNTAEQGLRLIWLALPLIDRLEIYDEGWREIEQAQLDVIRNASPAERAEAARETVRLAAVYSHMGVKEEYDARLLIDPAQRYQAVDRLVERAPGVFTDDEDLVFTAISDLPRADRRRLYDARLVLLYRMLSNAQLALLRTVSYGTEAEALVARLRLATEGRIDDAEGVRQVVERARALIAEKRQLQAALTAHTLAADERATLEEQLRQLGDLEGLLAFTPGADGGLSGTSFLGRLAEAAGSPDQFGEWALSLGADPFQTARQRILMAASGLSIDNMAIESAIRAVRAPPVEGAERLSAAERESRQTAANNALRQRVLDDPAVAEVLRRLSHQGPAGHIFSGRIERLAHADRFEELLGDFANAVNNAQWAEVFRLALMFSRNPGWLARFRATASELWSAYANVHGREREIMEEILRTGQIPVEQMLQYTGNVELLRTTLAQINETERARLRLGYHLRRENRTPADDDERSALQAFDTFEAQVLSSQSTLGIVDRSGMQAVIEATLGGEPTAAELRSPEGRFRAAALMYRMQQERLALGRGASQHFTETDETMVAAAREFAARWEHLREAGTLTQIDFAALSALHDRFSTRSSEFTQASQAATDIAGMVAATVAGVVIVIATGGVATPGVIALAAASGATARVITSEMFGADYYNALGEEGARSALLGGIDAALTVVGASLAARGAELLGLGGRALTTAAARAGGEAAELAGTTLGRRVAAGAVEAALDGAFSGTISEAVSSFTDARTWRRGVWNGLVQVGQAALIGGLTGLGTGALIGAAAPLIGSGLRSAADRLLLPGLERAIERAGAGETVAAARRAALEGNAAEAERLLAQIDTHLTPSQQSLLRRDILGGLPSSATSGTARAATPRQEALLTESTNLRGSALTADHLDAEFDIVRRSRTRESTVAGYIDEVDIGNTHHWRRKPDGTWCRFTTAELCGTVIPGSPIPFAGNTPAERLAVGRALIDEMRTEFGIAAQRHTVAVGWTDIDELASQRFRGASRSIRATAPLPAPTPHIVAPRAGTHFLDHAEQDIVNGFIDAVEGVGLGGSTLEGKTLRVHISHPRGPCAACAQGVTGADVDPGILLQLSQRYPGLTVSLSWETPAGQLQGMLLQNGMRL